jgi:glycosyltransferase involved in cell wall biosynthesis
VQLTVVGRQPTRRLRQYLETTPGVQHLEYVEDYVGFLEQDWVYVHPQRTNAGFQTKLQQVMALGIPVVGFEFGLSGIDVENGKHCYICQTQEEIAERAIALLRDPDLRRSIGLTAASRIRDRYSIKRVGEEMMQLYRGLART